MEPSEPSEPSKRRRAGLIARLMRRLFGKVSEVSPEMAACEFGCRELSCEQGRWHDCAHRLDWADQLAGNGAARTATKPTSVADDAADAMRTHGTDQS